MSSYRIAFTCFLFFILFHEWSSFNYLRKINVLRQSKIQNAIEKQEKQLLYDGGVMVNGYKVVEGYNKEWLEERGIEMLVNDLSLSNIYKFSSKDSMLGRLYYRNNSNPYISHPFTREFIYNSNKSRIYTANTFYNHVFASDCCWGGSFSLIDPYKNDKIYLCSVEPPCRDRNERIYFEINNIKKRYINGLKFSIPFSKKLVFNTYTRRLTPYFTYSEILKTDTLLLSQMNKFN